MFKKNSAGKDPGKDPKGHKDKKDPRKFFDTHPARQPGQVRKEPGAPEKHIDEREVALSQQILVYHEKQGALDAGMDWMYRLKEESMKFLAQQKGVHLQQLYRDSMYKKGIEQLIDKIYGILQRYMFEFNQVAAGTELHVAGTISGDVTEVTRYNKLREAQETETYFRARLSTRLYSLVMRGKDDRVDFYLLPVNKVMALSKLESEFPPLTSIQVKITEQGMMWRMAQGVPPIDSLDELCMWLFSNLVQATKDAAKEEEESATG